MWYNVIDILVSVWKNKALFLFYLRATLDMRGILDRKQGSIKQIFRRMRALIFGICEVQIYESKNLQIPICNQEISATKGY